MPDTTSQALNNAPTAQAADGNNNTNNGGSGEPGDVASLPAWAQDLLKSTRSEAAKHRTAANAAADRLAAIDAAKLTQEEQLAKKVEAAEERATKAEAARRDTASRLEVERLARKLNIVDEDAATLFISRSLEYDADGKPTNVEALLKDLVRTKPYLVASGGGGNAGGSPGNPPRGSGTLTIDDVKTMSREQILARWDEVQAAMKSSR